jgi:hypothetical protein
MSAQAVVTEVWRAVLARVFSRDLPDVYSEIDYFKIGEGGSSGGVPVAPSATRTDLESEGAPLSGGGTATFTNGLTSVVGIGTSFLADVSVGDWIKPGPTSSAFFGSSGVPGSEVDGWGQVLLVNNNLSITLVAPYAGATLAGREVRKAATPLFTFRKTLLASDVTFTSAVPAIFNVSTIVLPVEANATQLLVAPEFFEVAAFDANGVMVAYATIDQQTKTNTVELDNLIDVTT